ncbi:IS66 family insertion sequence element accessory protein TnpA [Photobacterium damselae]
MLIEQSESSSLSKFEFCKLNGFSPLTFYAKRQQLKETVISQGFIRDEIVENTIKYQASQTPTANMTLFVNDIELNIHKVRLNRCLIMKHMLAAPDIYLYG